MVHDLKIWPIYFGPVENGTMTFNVRKADRNYNAGDQAMFREWDPATQQYTGRVVQRRITYVLRAHDKIGSDFALRHDYCVIGLA